LDINKFLVLDLQGFENLGGLEGKCGSYFFTVTKENPFESF